jgi:hypothetical protein
MKPGCRSAILSISSLSLCSVWENLLLSLRLLLRLWWIGIGKSFSDSLPQRKISIAGVLMP